jgi:hypothetical protein
MFIDKDIQVIFDAVPSDGAAKFRIKRPPGILMPEGYNKGSHHMQSIQKTKRGEFVVSGSASKTGYIYFTSKDYEVLHVVCPEVYDINQNRLNHAGGCQVVDDILVVGLERSRSRKNGTSHILFYDVQDIRNPKFLPHLSVSRTLKKSTAGAVSLTNYLDKWLLLVANWGSQRLDFYLSNRGDLTHPDAFFGSGPWCSWSKDINGFTPDSLDDHWNSYQNFNMFTRNSARDVAWLIGMYIDKKDPKINWADLYQVVFEGGQAVVTKKRTKPFHRSGHGPRFKYSSGFFFNEPQGCFEVYAGEKHLGKETTNRCNKWALGEA